MKRFYNTVSIIPTQDGFQLLLDDKPARTPQKKLLIFPTQKLANLVVAEWQAQGDTINKTTMPMTAFSAIAIDIVPEQKSTLIEELLAYAQTDLLCYRSDELKLAKLQSDTFAPIIALLASEYHLELKITHGIMPVNQPEKNLSIVQQFLDALDAFTFAGVMVTTHALGSIFLAMLLKDRKIDANAALNLSRFDEIQQAEKWGITDTFEEKQEAVQKEIASLVQFFSTVI